MDASYSPNVYDPNAYDYPMSRQGSYVMDPIMGRYKAVSTATPLGQQPNNPWSAAGQFVKALLGAYARKQQGPGGGTSLTEANTAAPSLAATLSNESAFEQNAPSGSSLTAQGANALFNPAPTVGLYS